MKFTLNWLKSYLETDASLEAICAQLTTMGLEVEGVEDHAAALAPFIVAEILEANSHPDADKLQVCKVNNGSETLQIVCGAPNARAGIKVVLAPVGTEMPEGDFTIKPAKIRGVESSGMLCSTRELGLGEDHDGIMELPSELTVGKPFAPQLGLDDPVIEIAITPDRADCLGVYGVARDLAAAGLGTLKPLQVPEIAGSYASPVDVSLGKGDHSCKQFVGRTIKGVKNGPSPAWLQQRLKAIGLRPISALVDITNFITFDLGRPLHVYDADQLNGNITVRLSRDGETIHALNDKAYTTKAGATLISDDKNPLGFGGIIGGQESGCTQVTTNVFLEVAYFDPIDIAMTGRAYQIESDARYRFERGVDPEFLPDAAAIATQMILELCGGEASELVMAGTSPHQSRSVHFRPSRVQTLGGMDVAEAECKRILTALGSDVKEETQECWLVSIPSWRGDVEGEADLVEEVMRIVGFDNIPATPLPIPDILPDTTLPLGARRADAARHMLASRGLHEVHSWSFTHHETAALFGGTNPQLRLANPISSELDTMRPTPLPNLLQMVARNQDRGFAQVGLCEVGLGFSGLGAEGQQLMAIAVRGGAQVPANPLEKARSADLFDAKADAIAALEAAGAPVANLQVRREAPGYYHPGRSGALALGKNVLAVFGEIHPATLGALDVKGTVAACEVYLDAIPAPKGKKSAARASFVVSDLQSVQRDYSFFLAEDTLVAELTKALAGADKKHVSAVDVVSVYQDDALKAAGERSVAVRVTLQPQQQSFTEDALNAIAEALLLGALKVSGCRMSEALAAFAADKKLDKVLKAA